MAIQKKNKSQIRMYQGYFLLDSGLKIPFDISEYDGGDNFSLLYGNLEFLWKDDDIIWLGEENDLKILAKKIVGFDINEYFVEDK